MASKAEWLQLAEAFERLEPGFQLDIGLFPAVKKNYVCPYSEFHISFGMFIPARVFGFVDNLKKDRAIIDSFRGPIPKEKVKEKEQETEDIFTICGIKIGKVKRSKLDAFLALCGLGARLLCGEPLGWGLLGIVVLKLLNTSFDRLWGKSAWVILSPSWRILYCGLSDAIYQWQQHKEDFRSEYLSTWIDNKYMDIFTFKHDSENDILPPPWPIHIRLHAAGFTFGMVCSQLAEEDPEKWMENIQAPIQATGEYVFCKQGQGWFLRAFGKEGWFPDINGFWYLYRLITSPNGEVRMEALVLEGSSASQKTEQDYLEEMQKAQPDVLADPEAIRAAKCRLQKIKALLNDPDSPPDWEEREKREQEQEKLEQYLRSVQGLRGRPRKKDSVEKLRPLIRKALRAAYQKLRDQDMQELAQHFEKNIRASGDCYRYDNRLAWQ